MSEHDLLRLGLDLVARSLLEHETVDGAEVKRLIELSRSSAADAPSDAVQLPAGVAQPAPPPASES